MSKSAELDASRINLLDDPKLIQQKVKRAKTDTFEGLEFGNPDRPEATNLLGIYSLCTGISMVSLPACSALLQCQSCAGPSASYGLCLSVCLSMHVSVHLWHVAVYSFSLLLSLPFGGHYGAYADMHILLCRLCV